MMRVQYILRHKDGLGGIRGVVEGRKDARTDSLSAKRSDVVRCEVVQA